MQKRHILALAALATSLTAQSIIIPKEGLMEANSYGSDFRTHSYNQGKKWRVQHLYDKSHFINQGIHGPITIRRIRWRADAETVRGWNGGTYNQIGVVMGFGVDWQKMNTKFDLNGSGFKLVYSGALKIAPHQFNGASPGKWFVDITLKTPFVYDPTKGKDFLIDVITAPRFQPGNGSVGYNDVVRGSGARAAMCSGRFVVLGSGRVRQDYAPVIQLDYGTGFGTYAGFRTTGRSSAGSTHTVTFLSSSKSVWRTKSHVWDFGDGVRVVGGRLVTHTYKRRGAFAPSLTLIDQYNRRTTKYTPAGFIEVGAFRATHTQDKVGVAGIQDVTFTDTSPDGRKWEWYHRNRLVSNAKTAKIRFDRLGWDHVTYHVTSRYGIRRTRILYNAVHVYPRDTTLLSTRFDGTGSHRGKSGLMFDVEVKNPKGIRVSYLETVAIAPIARDFSVEVYLTPNSFRGKRQAGTAGARDNDRSKWTLVAKGTVKSSGNEVGKRSVVDVPDFLLPPGNWGVYVLHSAGLRFSSGKGVFSNQDLTIKTGLLKPQPFSGTVVEDRTWNGSFCYTPSKKSAAGPFAYGCAGSNQRVPELSILGLPTLGRTPTLAAAGMSVRGGPALLFFGVRPVELPLNVLGAPGCALQVQPMGVFAFQQSAGSLSVRTKIPLTAAPGVVLLQLAALDPGANALGVSLTNGLALRIGSN